MVILNPTKFGVREWMTDPKKKQRNFFESAVWEKFPPSVAIYLDDPPMPTES